MVRNIFHMKSGGGGGKYLGFVWNRIINLGFT